MKSTYGLAAQFENTCWTELMDHLPSDYLTSSFWRSVDKRKSEFLIGRYLAHLVIRQLDLDIPDDFLLSPNRHRAPQWPPGVIGSITHTNGYCHVVATRRDHRISVGIDSEQIVEDSKIKMFMDHILVDSEKALYSSYNEVMSLAEYATFIFSAKESIFKSIHPLTEIMFGFESAAILSIDLSAKSFIFRINKNLSANIGEGFLGMGHVSLDGSLIHTSVEILSSQITYHPRGLDQPQAML